MANSMTAEGVALVKRCEGLRLVAYRCPAGVWTIGWGHTGREVEEGDRITRVVAEDLLAEDLARVGRRVSRAVRVPLTNGQYSALVSFTFNVGYGAFEGSTLLKRLNEGDFDAVPFEMARWNKATVGGKKVVLAGLVKRRGLEGEMFVKK